MNPLLMKINLQLMNPLLKINLQLMNPLMKINLQLMHPLLMKINLQLINPLTNNLPQTNPPHAKNLQERNPHLPHRMIINLLKFHLIKVARVNLAVMKVNLVATKTVVSAITATGVNGASAHKTAVLVPKPALVKFWDHPTAPNVRKLRSHSHATLVLARTAVKQPLQATTTDLFINEVLFDYYY